MEGGKVLIVDPDRTTGDTLKDWFKKTDHRISVVDTGAKAISLIESSHFDVVLAEYQIEGVREFDLVKEIRRTRPNLPVVIFTGKYDSRTAIEVVKAGAFDFLPKPLEKAEIFRVLDEAINSSRSSANPINIGGEDAEGDGTSDALIGKSRAMLEVYKALGRLSATPVTVLIQGETGTGKELVARALYQYGHRSHRPFITVNCAAIPENLLESELFGHEKGSFTGAVTTRIGKFEQAHNATLFLDEIGDMDLNLQSKMLRVLQEKRFQRVGGAEEISVDVRIIAATHRDLQAMVAEGTFREDLYYRLNVAQIALPPLREREGDIPVLSQYFLERFRRETDLPNMGISKAALEQLNSGSWPGNVRQLQNVIRKAALNARGYSIDEANIALLMKEQARPASVSFHDDLVRILEEHKGDAHRVFLETFESRLFEAAMEQTGDNLSKAAELLGLSRFTLREKLKSYGLRD
ncbi:MAG: sigma-54 dependent transcriptional regulator [Verrucomicrobiales bacterium]|nr:sigma-54 dependent transcriptional regulator [Verrucomicrobiales bacterium]